MEENAMRFMILVRAIAQTEAVDSPAGSVDHKVVEDMTTYHEELQKAGVLLDGNGLKPSAKGFRIRYEGSKRTVVDGPFTEAKELIAGYTLIQVKSREEALEWARRFPNPFGATAKAEIEVRELYELEDFGSADAERFREVGVGGR
jgi:hypothetical protein